MKLLSEEICKAWENRDGAAVFATVSESGGVPNVIYISCVGLYENRQFVVADNYFDKTRKNIMSKSKGALLFKTKEGKAYQIKGILDYKTRGGLFDFMKSFNPPEHPGHAAAVLNPDEAYSGARKLF